MKPRDLPHSLHYAELRCALLEIYEVFGIYIEAELDGSILRGLCCEWFNVTGLTTEMRQNVG